MRSLALAALVVLPACSAVENRFTVDDERRAVTAAKLVLCGSETPLQLKDGQFSVRRRIDCEGRGHIRLTYAAGYERDCSIGYVTPGTASDWMFRASAVGCQAVES
jgi:hypothetical protein